MASTLAERSATMLVIALLVAPAAMAQVAPPEHPIQDATAICEPFLDTPVSGRDLSALEDPNLPLQDLDRDGFPNEDELVARSDPTDPASTPLDHDADGVRYADDPCDFDPRVPALIELVLECLPACDPPLGTSRNTILILNVTTKSQGTLEPADPDDPDGPGPLKPIVRCDIEHSPFSVLPLPTARVFNRTVEITRGPGTGPGEFRHNLAILKSDYAGHWHVTCYATFAGLQVESQTATIDVDPVPFGLVTTLDRTLYFETDQVRIRAIPDAAAHDPARGFANYTVAGANGEPLAEGTLAWNATLALWEGAFDPDVVPDPSNLVQDQPARASDRAEGVVFDGEWTVSVDAVDGAPGARNTGSDDATANVTSQLVDDLQVATNATALVANPVEVDSVDPVYLDDAQLPAGVENAVARRGDTLRYTVDYLHRGLPVPTALLQMRLGYQTPSGFVEAEPGLNMTADTLVPGRYVLDYRVGKANLTGDLVAVARLVHDGTDPLATPVDSNALVVHVLPGRVDLLVQTDKPVYASPILPSPAAWVADAAQNATGAPAAAIACLTGSDPGPQCAPGADVVGPVPPQDQPVGPPAAESVLITARPLGTAGADYIDDDAVPASPPGNATYSVFLVSGNVPASDHLTAADLDREAAGVPALAADGSPILDQPMTWTCPALEPCRFEATRALGPFDAPAQWQVVVRYRDDAQAPNRGEQDTSYRLRGPLELNHPPQVNITTINGADVSGGPVVVTNEGWLVQGTYHFTNNPAPEANLLDTNQVWVRVNSGDNPEWLRATVVPDPGTLGVAGNWTITLHSQRTYALNTSGIRDIQAVALVNPANNGDCRPGGSNAMRTACSTFSPNGPAGENLMGLPLATIYSSVDTAQADFHYPGEVRSVLLGVIGPDGQLRGNGDVLWDGTTHVLSGEIALNNVSTSVKEAKVHVERVAFDNCRDRNGALVVPVVSSDADFDEEWCRRDWVTAYDDPSSPSGYTLGYDLVSDPLGRAAVDVDADAAMIFFNWTWDIRDSKAWANNTQPKPCEGSRGGSDEWLVETNENLVRRTNSNYNISDNQKWPARLIYAGNGTGYRNCHQLYEQLEDIGSQAGETPLQPWLLSDFNQTFFRARGMYGQPSYIEPARYWVWLTVETDGGFWFNQTRPETADDVKERGGNLGAQAQADSPPPSLISNATGEITGYEAVQVRFGPYPGFTIDEVETELAGGGTIVAAPGQPGFQLLGESITLRGTVHHNGNTMDPSGLRLVFYMVEYDDCVGDQADPQGQANQDGFATDTDGEWCLLYTTSMPLTAADFGGSYDPSATAPPQSFEVQWTPPVLTAEDLPLDHAGDLQDPTDIWFVTVSQTTADGDRIEGLPPIVDPRAAPGLYRDEPQNSLKSSHLDVETYDFLRNTEYLCPGTACSHTNPQLNPALNNLSKILGLLGSDYDGVSLVKGAATMNVTAMGPFAPPRPKQDQPHGDPCVYTSFQTDTSCSYVGPHEIRNKKPRVFYGNLMGDALSVSVNATDFAVLNDLEELNVTFRTIGYALGTGTKIENRKTYQTLQEMTTLVDLGQESSSETVNVVRHMTTVSGQPYLEWVNVDLAFDVSQALETSFQVMENQRRVASAFNETLHFLRAEVELRLRSASGTTTTLLLDVQVDRISPANVTLDRVHQVLWDAATNSTSQAILDGQALYKGQVDVGGRSAPLYTVNGNAYLDMLVRYPNGVDLGSDAVGAGRLTAIDASQGLLGPPMEWQLGSPRGNSPIESVDTPAGPVGAQHPFVLDESTPVVGPLIFPLEICPDDDPPIDPADSSPGSACAYDGNQGRGTRLEGVTVFLLPIRVGLDPAFVKVTMRDPWDPTTWDIEPNPGDRTYGVDLTATGVIVDPAGDGFAADTSEDNHTAVRFFYVGSEGTIDPDHLSDTNASVGMELILRNAQPTSGNPANGPREIPRQLIKDNEGSVFLPLPYPPWAQAGFDEGWQESCQPALTTPGSDVVAACLYTPWLPFGYVTPDALTCTVTTLTPDAIDECYEGEDQYWECMQEGASGPAPIGVPPPTAECDGLGFVDETLREAQLLFNRNLPLWIHSNAFDVTSETGKACTKVLGKCNGRDYEPAEDPDADRRGDGNFTIPRGFLWEHHAQLGSAIVAADETTATLRLDRFNQVYATLDPASPDFGRLNLPDGRYVVTVKGVDNTESFTSTDPAQYPDVANDACCYTDIVIELENDADDDGVSDLREDWLRRKIQTGWMRDEIDPTGAYADRYYDRAAAFPNASDPASNEEDWDGDGVPNNVILARPALPPEADALPIPTVGPPFVRVDIERHLNMDPLVPDLADGEPGTCDAQGLNPLGRNPGKGPFGDRNNNCRANIADTDQKIVRCDDTDRDGWCDGEEELYGSNATDPQSTPRDIDGDGVNDDIEEVLVLTELLPGAPCLAAGGQECADGHWATFEVNAGGIGHVYVDQDDQVPPSFSVGYSYAGDKPDPCDEREEGHCQVVSDATADDAREAAIGLLNGRICAPTLLPDPFLRECLHGHTATITVGEGAVDHLYVDADPDDPENASVGFAYVGQAPPGCEEVEPGHCQVVGGQTVAEALLLAKGVVDGAICAPAVLPDPFARECPGGHWATATIDQAGIGYLYIDERGPTPQTRSYEVGFAYTGDPPPACTPTGPNECRLFETTSVEEALAALTDADDDGYPTQAELAGSDPNAWSNPFYARSTPDRPETPEDENGFGFPADWDGDRYKNERENGVSDPTQRCSTPAQPNGWSLTNPRPACE